MAKSLPSLSGPDAFPGSGHAFAQITAAPRPQRLSLPTLLAQTSAPATTGGGFDITFFLMMGGIFLVFYLLILRPQKQEQEKKQKEINALKKGDRVISIGGIHGSIVDIDAEAGTVQVQVDRGVRLTFNRTALVPAKKEEAKKDDAKKEEPAKEAGKKSA